MNADGWWIGSGTMFDSESRISCLCDLPVELNHHTSSEQSSLIELHSRVCFSIENITVACIGCHWSFALCSSNSYTHTNLNVFLCEELWLLDSCNTFCLMKWCINDRNKSIKEPCTLLTILWLRSEAPSISQVSSCEGPHSHWWGPNLMLFMLHCLNS